MKGRCKGVRERQRYADLGSVPVDDAYFRRVKCKDALSERNEYNEKAMKDGYWWSLSSHNPCSLCPTMNKRNRDQKPVVRIRQSVAWT